MTKPFEARSLGNVLLITIAMLAVVAKAVLVDTTATARKLSMHGAKVHAQWTTGENKVKEAF